MGNSILNSAANAFEVNAMMLIETLVLGINQRMPESGRYLTVPHRYAVLLKIAAKENAIGAEHLTASILRRRHYLIETWRLAEKPKEVDVYHSKIYEHGNNKRHQSQSDFSIPLASSV